jgi:hypothetical protein
MRKWVKFTIIGVAVAVLGMAAFAGVGAYYVFRHLDTGTATEADTLREFDAIRVRFGPRQPLIDLVNPQAGDIRVNRLVHPEGRRASVIHILAWDAEKGERLETDVPLWLMRFSSLNILSKLGLAPDRFRLTVQDVERYGPGIVADYRTPGRSHVIVWVE